MPNPIVLIGEYHEDAAIKSWLLKSLPTLYERGYRCFAYEFNQGMTLDEMILKIEADVKAIEDILKLDIDQYIEDKTKLALTQIITKIDGEHAQNSVAEMFSFITEQRGHEVAAYIKQQIEVHANNARKEKETNLNLLPVTKNVLAILKMIRTLNMDFQTVDLTFDRNPKAVRHYNLDQIRDQRDEAIATNLTFLSKKYDVNVIFLGGFAHLWGIIQNLLNNPSFSEGLLTVSMDKTILDKQEIIETEMEFLKITYPSSAFHLQAITEETLPETIFNLPVTVAVLSQKAKDDISRERLQQKKELLSRIALAYPEVKDLAHAFRLWAADLLPLDFQNIGIKILALEPTCINASGDSGKTATDFAKSANNTYAISCLEMWGGEEGQSNALSAFKF